MPALGYRYPKGIFALQHRATKKIYLGYTRNFEKERLRIKAAFQGSYAYALPEEVADMGDTRYEDWSYVKMQNAHPDADVHILRNMLREALDKVGERAPELLLNRSRPHKASRPQKYIVEVKGKRYSLNALATAYNLEPATLHQRYHRGIRGDQLIAYTPRNRAHRQAQARAQKDTAKT